MTSADYQVQLLQDRVRDLETRMLQLEDRVVFDIQPERPWVGLTDEDRKLVRLSVGYNQFMTAGEYAKLVQKATEAKLKEKNT